METNAYLQGKAAILKAFTVKGYKSWTAREGVGAQTTLYKDGKNLGLCTDEGNGGDTDFRESRQDGFKTVFDFVKTLPQYKFGDMWKDRFGEELDESSWMYEDRAKMTSWTVFELADLMLEQAEEEKQLRQKCKTKILVRYEGDPPEDFRVFNAKWPKDTWGQLEIMSRLAKQVQPQVIVEFINRRFD